MTFREAETLDQITSCTWCKSAAIKSVIQDGGKQIIRCDNCSCIMGEEDGSLYFMKEFHVDDHSKKPLGWKSDHDVKKEMKLENSDQ